MYIFTCEDRFEDMMCCIYQAWEKALKVGHGCVRLEKRGEEQPSLFDEYVHVEYDEEEYKKVVRSIFPTRLMHVYITPVYHMRRMHWMRHTDFL